MPGGFEEYVYVFFSNALAQTWHAIAEFHRLHNRFITACIKSSSQVAPGQAKTKARSGAFQKGADVGSNPDFIGTVNV